MSKVRVLVNDTSYELTVLNRDRNVVEFELDDRLYRVEFEQSVPQYSATAETPTSPSPSATSSPRSGTGGQDTQIVAPIPGVIVEVLVSKGDRVSSGDVVARLEAMKMQNNIFAQSDGRVVSVCVSPGEEVADGQLLIELEKDDS